jgi:hypothetical protein
LTEDGAFRRLLDTTDLTGPISLLLGDEPDSRGVTRYRLASLNEKVSTKFRERILFDLSQRKARDDLTTHTVHEFDPNYGRERGLHSLSWIDLDGDRHLREALAHSIPKALTGLDHVTESVAKGDPPRSFVLATKLPSGETVRFFKRVKPLLELADRGRVYALLTKSEFKDLRGAPFAFDFSFTCIQVDRYLFILSPNSFEKLFSYRSRMLEVATEIVPKTEPYLDGTSYATFKDAVKTSTFAARRMPHIERELGSGRVSVAKWSVIIEAWGLEQVKVAGVGDEARLTYDGKHPRELIKLLSGDYCLSEASGERWDASYKRAPRTPRAPPSQHPARGEPTG